MEYVYLTHSALELVLGAIKLRGRYQHEAVGSRLPRSEMYTRHHGASILSLALLSWLVYSADGKYSCDEHAREYGNLLAFFDSLAPSPHISMCNL